MRKILIILISFAPIQLLAQQSFDLRPGDSIHFNLPAVEGDIQWQQSTDEINWSDIEDENDNSLNIAVWNLPQYFRAAVIRENCDTYYSETISASTSFELWSNPATWSNNEVPQAGEVVTIPADKRILLDINPPELGGLTIEGHLEFGPANLELTSEWIMVMGEFRIGYEDNLHQQSAIITLNDTDTEESIMNMGTRGIMVMGGGSLELHGQTPEVLWTKIDGHMENGSTTLNTITETQWNAENQIVIAPTDYYEANNGASISQVFSISEISSNQITTTEPSTAHRWGLLQYPTQDGISLSDNNLLEPPVDDTDTTSTPLVLDERAAVGLLTRGIVIQAPDDDTWNNDNFGVHTMIMPGSEAHVEGVQFLRAGQLGRLRRYAFHWHMLSYAGTETMDDATDQYFRNNSIQSSKNRGVVIHGTNGVTVQNNVIYDIQGHGVFTEDAVERRNLIDNNLVLHVRNPDLPLDQALKQHEVGTRGSSGFWLSNPDNTITNNHAADCGTNGFWLAYPNQPWGESIEVLAEDGELINPSRIRFGTFEGNTAHSNRMEGIMLDNVEIDNLGNTFPHQYQSTTDGRDIAWPYPTLRRFALAKLSLWKNGSNGIWDRSVWPDNIEIVSADNSGRFFAGSGADGVIERCLVIGTSLNHLMNGTDRPLEADFQGELSTSVPTAFATYHSTFDIKNNIVINFPLESTRSGVFATEDYYIRPVEKGQFRNTNNLILDSHPGVKLEAPFNYFTLASALWDPNGIWGPAENYFVYDVPFMTHGLEVITVQPGPESGGVSVPGPFYGFEGFVMHGVGTEPPQNQPYFDLMAISVNRYDDAMELVDTWTVDAAEAGWALSHMRDFAAHPSGIYELSFPDEANGATEFQVNVHNMLTEEDSLIVGIHFDGGINPVVFTQAYQFYEVYDEVENLEAVRNSTGKTWYQDSDNDMVWVKLKGGIWQFWTTDPTVDEPSSDDLLYEEFQLVIREAD